MTEQDGKRIGNKIGVTEECDIRLDGIGWGEFLRVRVNVDISKPLCRAKKISFRRGERLWVSFQYERLPYFYS